MLPPSIGKYGPESFLSRRLLSCELDRDSFRELSERSHDSDLSQVRRSGNKKDVEGVRY